MSKNDIYVEKRHIYHGRNSKMKLKTISILPLFDEKLKMYSKKYI